jgi:hypothetical protein
VDVHSWSFSDWHLNCQHLMSPNLVMCGHWLPKGFHKEMTIGTFEEVLITPTHLLMLGTGTLPFERALQKQRPQQSVLEDLENMKAILKDLAIRPGGEVDMDDVGAMGRCCSRSMVDEQWLGDKPPFKEGGNVSTYGPLGTWADLLRQ